MYLHNVASLALLHASVRHAIRHPFNGGKSTSDARAHLHVNVSSAEIVFSEMGEKTTQQEAMKAAP